MSANHSDGQGSRPTPPTRRRTGGLAPTVRKPVVKRYGANAKYPAPGESPYERRRRARREGGAS